MSGPGVPGDGKEAGKNAVAGEQKAASPLQVIRAVLWSFIGIRKKSGYEEDVAKIKPVQVIVAGILVAAVFVGCLVTLVRFLTAK